MPKTLRKFLYLIGQHRRWRWLVVIGVAVVAGVLEIAGALLVFLLLGMIADPEGTLSLPIIGDLPDLSSSGDNEATLLWVSVGIAVFFIVRAMVRVGQAYLQNRLTSNAGATLAKRMVRGYLNLPYEFHLQRNSAELIRNAHDAPRSLARQVFLPVVAIASESILLAGMISLLIVAAPIATGLALLFMVPTVLVLAKVVQPRLKSYGQEAHHLSYVSLSSLQQSLRGLRDIKLLGLERVFTKDYGRSRDGMAQAHYRMGTAQELPRTLIETSLLLFILAFFGFAIIQGSAANDTLPVLGLFAYAGLRMQPSIQMIVRSSNNLKFSSAAMDDVYDDLVMLDNQPWKDHERPDERLPFNREIVLDGVGYQYAETDRPALSGVNLHIENGDFVGICGATGGGKTTLVDLISGLLEPTAGRILVDGVDIADHPHGWQANLGAVPQSVFLMDDTLRRNIAFGLPDQDIDESTLNEVLHMAQLDTFVSTLPHGLETRVGEQGIRLSGGQRQRVAIARALYRRPSVLIMDEGTSALDNLTETQLVNTLERVRGERTIIVVAHRLSSVRSCDYIIFVDEGRVVGTAPFAELVETNSTFREMAAKT